MTCKVDENFGAYLFFDLNGINKFRRNFTFNLALINSLQRLENIYSINVFMDGLEFLDDKKILYNCSARIKSIDDKGLMKIQFNETMDTNFSLSLINE